MLVHPSRLSRNTQLHQQNIPPKRLFGLVAVLLHRSNGHPAAVDGMYVMVLSGDRGMVDGGRREGILEEGAAGGGGGEASRR